MKVKQGTIDYQHDRLLYYILVSEMRIFGYF